MSTQLNVDGMPVMFDSNGKIIHDCKGKSDCGLCGFMPNISFARPVELRNKVAIRDDWDDRPRCGTCNKLEPRYHCIRCGTNYCSKECQTWQWQHGNHKRTCELKTTLKETMARP